MRLGICIPMRAGVPADSFSTLLGAVVTGALWWTKQGEGNDVVVLTHGRSHVTMARNEIARLAEENAVDWCMWFDDDAIPPVDVIPRMFSHGKSIVGPVHRLKKPPYQCPAMRFNPETDEKTPVPLRQGLVEVDWMGMHCCLIKTEVFGAVRKVLLDSGDPVYKDGGPFFSRNGLGEDVFFFQAARAAGYRTYLDSDYEVDHVVETSVSKLMELGDA